MSTGPTATLPGEVAYGYVADRILLAIGDTTRDPDRTPDGVPARGMVTFTPVAPLERTVGEPATIIKRPVACVIHQGTEQEGDPDAEAGGLLIDPAGHIGNVALIVGHYVVRYTLDEGHIPEVRIKVEATHTESNPLWVPREAPIAPTPDVKFVVNEQVHAEALAAADAAEASAIAAQMSADEVQAMVDAGTPGPPGPAATVTVDSVSTGVAGSSATVENVGTSSAAELRFTIPRGDKGAPGHTPEFSWDGSVLKIDGTPGPDLRGPVGEGAVVSVNGKSGEVVLTAADVGARPAGSVAWAEVSGKPTILTTANVNSLIDAALGPVGDVLDAILDGVN